MAGGSGGTPNACGVYAARYVSATADSETTFTCEFDRPTLTLTCRDDAAYVHTLTWATIEAAVAEHSLIGRVTAIRSTIRDITETSAICALRFEYDYDSIGRPSSIVAISEPENACGGLSYFYDAWDAEGRATHASVNGVGAYACVGQNVNIEYDDTNRVITYASSGGADCFDRTTSLTYDENGLPVSTSDTGSLSGEYTYTTLETGEICVD